MFPMQVRGGARDMCSKLHSQGALQVSLCYLAVYVQVRSCLYRRKVGLILDVVLPGWVASIN